MKHCPFCNAEIEENARFCLYCMNSLEEKQKIVALKNAKKRWLVLLFAILFSVLLCICIALIVKKTINTHNSIDKISDSQTSTQIDTNKTPGDESSASKPSSSDSTLHNQEQSETEHSNDPDNTINHSSSSANSTNVNSTTQRVPDSSNSTEPDSNTTTSTVTYRYRDAKLGDDFSVHADLDNCIVIIGVNTASSNGEYTIPETINGKKVISIMGLAFCDASIRNTVRKVIIPGNVKTIWGNAFVHCYNLTDIYFCGQSLYVESNAFAEKSKRTGNLTIHCSYNCEDRNFRYYRNSAIYYDALYEEWNN